MLIQPLFNEERSTLGATHRVLVTTKDLTTSADNTAQVFDLFAVKARQHVRLVKLIVHTPFRDPADAAYNSTTISVGDSAQATVFANAIQANANGSFVPVTHGGAGNVKNYTGAATVRLTVNSMTAKNLAALKEGVVEALLEVVDTTRQWPGATE